jgi:hypothetical protein
MRKRLLIFSCVLGIAQLIALDVAADEEGRFRRTTPRGSFGRDGPELIIGVPVRRARLGHRKRASLGPAGSLGSPRHDRGARWHGA